MTLSTEQQELLHAWVDGETTEAEQRVVAQLTEDPATRDEAQVYIHELKRVRELLSAHGGVPVPPGLRERVMLALDEEQAPIIRLPLVNWKTAFVAAAAAVVVSLALVFAPPAGEESATDGVADTPEETATTPQLRPVDDVVEDMREDPAQTEGQGKRPNTNADRGPNGVGRVSPEKEHLETPKPPAQEPANTAATVLRLDAGYDLPYEVSINMNRSREASVLQVYNDILVVGSLHGDARILDDSSTLGAWTDGESFNGRDFSIYDGVEIEVDPARVPELLSAINRMSSDQGYGEVILPGYMRTEVGALAEETRQLQDATDEIARSVENAQRRKGSEAGAQGYLPNDIQRDSLRKLAEEVADVKVDGRLSKLLKGTSEPHLRGTMSDSAGGRKVKLLIRLR